MKLLRAIRLDPSDTFAFPTAAVPGEWVISGAFAFSDVDLAALTGRERAAFRGGFLGVPSLGWSTLAQIVEVDTKDSAAAIDVVARCLLGHFGAPDLAAARKAAEEEIGFAATLCDHPPDTLIAVRRVKEAGAIHEGFRTLRPRAGAKPWRSFSFLETENEPVETVDFVGMAREERG